MGDLQYAKSSKTQAGAPAGPVTAAEDALTDRTDILAWFDAKGWSAERVDGVHITDWYSYVPVGALYPKVSAVSTSQGLNWGIVPGGTARDEIRFGIDAAGSAIAGFNNKKATGNAQFVMPATDFSIFMYARVLTPSSNTPLIGTTDTTDPFALTVTSTGQFRAYSAYSSTLIASGNSAIPDQDYHELLFRYDVSELKGELLVDGSVVKAMSALDLSAHVGQTLQFGQLTDGGSTQVAGVGFAVQGVILLNTISTSTTLGLYDTVLGERPT